MNKWFWMRTTNDVIMISIFASSFMQNTYLLFFIVFGSIPIHIQVNSILEDTPIS